MDGARRIQASAPKRLAFRELEGKDEQTCNSFGSFPRANLRFWKACLPRSHYLRLKGGGRRRGSKGRVSRLSVTCSHSVFHPGTSFALGAVAYRCLMGLRAVMERIGPQGTMRKGAIGQLTTLF
jgi:hypothetical protein